MKTSGLDDQIVLKEKKNLTCLRILTLILFVLKWILAGVMSLECLANWFVTDGSKSRVSSLATVIFLFIPISHNEKWCVTDPGVLEIFMGD